MGLPEGAWQVAAAVIAVVGTWWQFAGMKDGRRATEIQQLEDAIASAHNRADRLEHAYRAHLLQRMQSMHGDRRSALPLAALYLLLCLLFLAMLSSTNWIVQGAAFIALAACFLQAMRYFGIYRYTTWSQHIETGAALERAMVEARLAFQGPALESKPLEVGPTLLEAAGNAWRKVDADRRRDLIVGATLMLVGMVVAFKGPGWSYAGDVSWRREALPWAAWLATAGIASLPVFSRTLGRLSRSLRPFWIGVSVRWGSQIAWVAAALLWLQPALVDFVYWLIDHDHIDTVEDLWGTIAIYVVAGLMFLWQAAFHRGRRLAVRLRRRRRRALSPMPGEVV